MKEHIHWQELEADSVSGYGVQIIYTLKSFDAHEIELVERYCKEYIKEGITVDGVRVEDVNLK